MNTRVYIHPTFPVRFVFLISSLSNTPTFCRPRITSDFPLSSSPSPVTALGGMPFFARTPMIIYSSISISVSNFRTRNYGISNTHVLRTLSSTAVVYIPTRSVRKFFRANLPYNINTGVKKVPRVRSATIRNENHDGHLSFAPKVILNQRPSTAKKFSRSFCLH